MGLSPLTGHIATGRERGVGANRRQGRVLGRGGFDGPPAGYGTERFARSG